MNEKENKDKNAEVSANEAGKPSPKRPRTMPAQLKGRAGTFIKRKRSETKAKIESFKARREAINGTEAKRTSKIQETEKSLNKSYPITESELTEIRDLQKQLEEFFKQWERKNEDNLSDKDKKLINNLVQGVYYLDQQIALRNKIDPKTPPVGEIKKRLMAVNQFLVDILNPSLSNQVVTPADQTNDVSKEPESGRESRAEISDMEDSSVESEATEIEDSEVNSEEEANNFLKEKKDASMKIIGPKPTIYTPEKDSSSIKRDIASAEKLISEVESWSQGKELNDDQRSGFDAVKKDLGEFVESRKKKILSRVKIDALLEEAGKIMAEFKKMGVHMRTYEDRLADLKRVSYKTGFVEQLEKFRYELENNIHNRIKYELKIKKENFERIVGADLKGKSSEAIASLKEEAEMLIQELESWREKISASRFSPTMNQRYGDMLEKLRAFHNKADIQIKNIHQQTIMSSFERPEEKKDSGLTEYQEALTSVLELAKDISNLHVKENKTNLGNAIKMLASDFDYRRWIANDKPIKDKTNLTDHERAFIAIDKLDRLLKRAEKAMKVMEGSEQGSSRKKVPGISRVWEKYTKNEVRLQLEKMAKDPIKSALERLLEEKKAPSLSQSNVSKKSG